MLQYNYRSFHIHTKLNDLDVKMIDILVRLSIDSFYEIVRNEARTNLFFLLGQYPYSALHIVPKLVHMLRKTNDEKESSKLTKEQLEGCLLLLNGNGMHASLLVKQNWKVIGKIWPSLFRSKHFDKEKIQKLVENIYSSTNENYESFDNQTRISSRTIDLAFKMSPSLIESYHSNEVRLKHFFENCNEETKIISSITKSLINIVNDSNIMWKNQEISLFSLIYILNPAVRNPKLLTSEFVQIFVDSLVHENINFRRVSFI